MPSWRAAPWRARSDHRNDVHFFSFSEYWCHRDGQRREGRDLSQLMPENEPSWFESWCNKLRNLKLKLFTSNFNSWCRRPFLPQCWTMTQSDHRNDVHFFSFSEYWCHHDRQRCEGRDLIMWPEGQWEASKKLHEKGTYRRTSQLLDQLGPEGQVGEEEKNYGVSRMQDFLFTVHSCFKGSGLLTWFISLNW